MANISDFGILDEDEPASGGRRSRSETRVRLVPYDDHDDVPRCSYWAEKDGFLWTVLHLSPDLAFLGQRWMLCHPGGQYTYHVSLANAQSAVTQSYVKMKRLAKPSKK